MRQESGRRPGGGAPRGNRNALKHGLYTVEAIETRHMVAALTKQARELVDNLS
jgi:glucans biosynthesis protein